MAAGQPPKYKSVEELQAAIDNYFDSIKGVYETLTNEETGLPEQICVKAAIPASITELCYHLGFESRQSFHDYAKNKKYSYTIKRARLKIEIEYEKKLNQQSPTGAIFALKNLGWQDKQQTELSGPNGGEIKTSNSLTVTIVEGLRPVPAKSEQEIADEIEKDLEG